MSLRHKYLAILSELVPAGIVGASMLLGLTAPGSASEHPSGLQPRASATVAERLAAIRDAVSALAQEGERVSERDDLHLAWGNWWRNWGWWRPWRWGWPNWPNWRNWNNWPNWWRNW
jgi:hypothetical protein